MYVANGIQRDYPRYYQGKFLKKKNCWIMDILDISEDNLRFERNDSGDEVDTEDGEHTYDDVYIWQG